MGAFNVQLFQLSKDQWLVTLLALLVSAFVLAEQSEILPSYDELMKNTIYGSAGTWRSKPITQENEWRRSNEGVEPGFGSSIKREASYGDNKNAGHQFDFDPSLEESSLFKIEI